jgi:hypothetical protein
MTPSWILDVVAAITLAVAAVSAARIVAARPWRRDGTVIDTDVSHLLMGIAMAGVLAPGLATLPDAGWEIVFAMLTAWFAIRFLRDARADGARALAGRHTAPHLVHSAAMLYMFLAIANNPMSGTPGMAAMAGTTMSTLQYPALAFAFALALAGYGIWDLDQLSGRRYSAASTGLSLVGVPLAGVPASAVLETGGLETGGLETGGLETPPAAAAVVPAAAAAAAASPVLRSPAVTVGCRIVMGVSMVLMLLIMI